MKKFIKNNLKAITTFIIGLIVSGGVVYAAVAASAVTYSNTNSGLKDSNGNNVTNVQDAIDVLYNKSTGNNFISLLNSGTAIELGGYKWHIIGQDKNNMYLLMDAGQLSNMNHCRTGSSSNCTWNGEFYVYSWENSLIRDYLNKDTEGGFLYTLPANVKAKLVETEVCKDPSLYSSDTWSYGGYTKSEIQTLSSQGASCSNGYTSDKVRLISQSEYFNLTNYSSYASTTTYPYAATGMGNGKGYIPRVSYIQNRVSDSSWLYSSTISYWWTMSANTHSYPDHVQYARNVGADGGFYNIGNGENSRGVRPVIVLQK